MKGMPTTDPSSSSSSSKRAQNLLYNPWQDESQRDGQLLFSFFLSPKRKKNSGREASI